MYSSYLRSGIANKRLKMPRGNEKPQLKEIQWSKEQTTINKAIIVAYLGYPV